VADINVADINLADINAVKSPGKQALSGLSGPLTPFGFDLIDSETGGLIRNKLYLLYGPTAAWKTSIAIHFIYEGLRNDQRALYVTAQDPEAVIVQAERLGFNLRPHIQDEKLILLSLLPRVSQQLALISDYEQVMAELQRLCSPAIPDRLVFDPIEALISHENKANVLPATKLLAEALKEVHATTLCLLDESPEPYVQVILKELISFSFGVFHMTADPDEGHAFSFRKVIWQPKEYARVPLSLQSRQGVQVIAPATDTTKPRLTLATGEDTQELTPPIELPRTIHLLLVDNDDFYHEMLQEFLAERYQVEQVSDSLEALSRLLERTYDIIMVNLNMPRSDGREVCLRIRQHHGEVPLIAFSNRLKRGADVASVLRIGVDTFISRPLAFNQVKATLEALLRRPPGPNSFDKARELIAKILEEQAALKRIPKLDPATGFNTRDYFEQKLNREIDKAMVGDYSFSIAGYRIESKDGSPQLEERMATLVRPLLRDEDLIIQYAPNYYLVFLDECLGPGVRRFNDRLRKTLKKAAGSASYTFQYTLTTFPNDGDTYDELLALVLNPLEVTPSPHLKRLQ